MVKKTKKNYKSKSIKIYKLGSIKLQVGIILPDAFIAYKTYGKLNKKKSNVIIYPTWFSGFVSDNEWLIGYNMALDPSKYFIIVVCAFGNGQSSSPSNTPSPFDKGNFPHITLYDNVIQQHRLVTEYFNIKSIKLVVGWSMGAQQTYQWACLYPEMVEKIAPFCGSAKTSPHNFVFLEGVKAALTTDCNWKDGFYTVPPTHGICSFGTVYSGWGFSQAFYKEELWRTIGYHSLENFIIDFWQKFFLKRDANNLLTMLWTWQNADISKNSTFNGDFNKALNAIKAKTLIMPAKLDLYFPVADNEDEYKIMITNYNDVKLVIIPGIWGHFAGGGLNNVDTDFIDNELKDLLVE